MGTTAQQPDNSPLKVGETVFCDVWNYGERVYFKQTTVVRTTATLAILANGDRVKNSAREYMPGGKDILFCIVGGGYESYRRLTDEKQEELIAWERQRKMRRWFDSQKFTDDQKAKIYELFNPTEPCS